MKKTPAISFLFLLLVHLAVKAQCPSGQSEIAIVIDPDDFPDEISWTLVDYASQASIAAGGYVGQTLCVPNSQCVEFKLYDDFGDGIFSPGFCKVFLDGVEVFTTAGAQYEVLSTVLNCPPGTTCTSAEAVVEGVHTAPGPDFWYRFVPPVNGNYTFTTCGLSNTCDTKLYAYDHCPNLFDEGPLGVIGYNDNFCGTGSEFILPLEAGHAVIIRVGDDELSSCAGQPIQWSFMYTGPISGCMDPLACNFNPLAEIPDNSQCEYPPAGQTCDGPDLIPGYETLVNSLQVFNQYQAQPCEVAEGCILGTGVRQLLAYGMTIWNIGNQPYYPGTPQNNPDGYEWAECHGHYHYIGFAEAYLYDENYQQVDFARKTSYAIVNTDCLPGVTPNGPALAPGCGDTYPAGYGCQWVDITNIAAGNYNLVVRVNGPQLPDFLGRAETNLDNNAIQLCLYIGEDADGQKYVNILPNCQPFVDCAGVPLGNAVEDCAGICGGTHLRGDVSLDEAYALDDVSSYTAQIVLENIDPVTCNQLTNDDKFTVLDVARLNACVRFEAEEHGHIGGGSGSHAHCNFPFHIENQQESVELGLTNLTANYFDIYADNNLTYLLGLELELEGVVIDSVVNLVSNFNPTITFNQNGHILALALDEFPLNKYFDEPLLRVYYREATGSTICIAKINDAVNADAEQISTQIGDCLTVSSTNEEFSNIDLSIAPNPSNGQIQVSIEGGLLGDANFRVTDLAGRTIATARQQANRNYYSLDFSNQPDGIYFLSIENEKFAKTAKFVITH